MSTTLALGTCPTAVVALVSLVLTAVCRTAPDFNGLAFCIFAAVAACCCYLFAIRAMATFAFGTDFAAVLCMPSWLVLAARCCATLATLLAAHTFWSHSTVEKGTLAARAMSTTLALGTCPTAVVALVSLVLTAVCRTALDLCTTFSSTVVPGSATPIEEAALHREIRTSAGASVTALVDWARP